MKAQFNLIKSANQNIKISFKVLKSITNKKKFKPFSYNKELIFDYLILLNKDLIVTKTKVLIYREDYGGEIGSKRWLKQFIGKSFSDKLTYEKDIIPISGATISAVSMTKAMNTFLQDLDILHKNEIL